MEKLWNNAAFRVLMNRAVLAFLGLLSGFVLSAYPAGFAAFCGTL